MSIFIKTGYWKSAQHGYDNWFNLTKYIGDVSIPDAPFDNTTYGRKNGAWEPVSGGGGSQDLNSVLGFGNTAIDKTIILNETSTNHSSTISASSIALNNFVTGTIVSITDGAVILTDENGTQSQLGGSGVHPSAGNWLIYPISATTKTFALSVNGELANPAGDITIVSASASVTGLVNNTALQELGGVDKLIHGVRAGTGNGNINYCTVFGKGALGVNSGESNTAIGDSALALNTTGNNNTGVGDGALGVNIVGTGNTGIGASALFTSTSSNNTAVGAAALTRLTSGDKNTAVGSGALFFSTTATRNVAIGLSAMQNNTIGGLNTCVGHQAGGNVSTGVGNTLIGYSFNVSAGITTGSNNTIIGPADALITGITTGSGNVIVGKVTGLTAALANNIVLANGVGNIKAQNDGTNWAFTGQINKVALDTAPATATSTGVLGEIRFTTGFIYLCTATNVWVRVALATF